jgi:uncharacterized protein (TIGR00297 family)
MSTIAPLFQRIIIGFALAAVIAGLARWRRSLSTSGALAAIVLGTFTYAVGGLAAAVLLVAFFVPSSALSLWKKQRRKRLAGAYSKGSERDVWQVLANGGLFGLGVWLAGGQNAGLAWQMAVTALACACADTWATELGGLARQQPRLITTWRKVAPGTSGAVSWLGTGAALAGALWIAGLAWLWQPDGVLWLWVAGCGWCGAMLDSWLGATVQAQFYCPHCAQQTEQNPTHHCGTLVQFRHGWRWLQNDAVNFLAALGAIGLLGLGLWLV